MRGLLANNRSAGWAYSWVHSCVSSEIFCLLSRIMQHDGEYRKSFTNCILIHNFNSIVICGIGMHDITMSTTPLIVLTAFYVHNNADEMLIL